MSDEDAFGEKDEQLRQEDIVPVRGTWRGFLFENPTANYPRTLTWALEIECREHDGSGVIILVDWMKLPITDWRKVPADGRRMVLPEAEGSIYFFMHHVYSQVKLKILEQQGSKLRVELRLLGDEMDLGIEDFTVETILDFEGIVVNIDKDESAEGALKALREFTSTEGLAIDETFHSTKFVPVSI